MESESKWTKDALHVLYSASPRDRKRFVPWESVAQLVFRHAGVGVTPEQCMKTAVANGWAAAGEVL